ncbi:ABC transporter ATP-binding protein [Candidatus Bathyarchaeota archaeon]|nr:ABC transporter ATP-binding protein [Candidatus Bathyarchaeota archaeon]
MVEVELRGITKRFGDVTAAGDISLTIEDGEFFTLLGPSGCGKTTTMRIIAGLEYPDEGQIIFDGNDVTEFPSFKRNTGMVFQNYALWPHLKVADNIAYGLKVRKVPKEEIKRRVEEALELVKLGGLGGRFPSQLSGGQQQRVALARVLIINPAVMLLDEPLSNLDAKLRVEMREEIKDLQKKLGITTIYVTHDQEEAMTISDRIAVQDLGVVRQLGTPSEIYNHPVDLFIATFIGRGSILDGRIHIVDDKARVMVNDQIICGVDTTGNLKEGDAAVCIMRPENFTLESTGEQENLMEGVVEWEAFIGPYKEVKLNVDGRTVLVDVPPETQTGIGNKLRVYILHSETIVLSKGEIA